MTTLRARPAPAAAAVRRRRGRPRAAWWPTALLAVVSYLPLLLTSRGQVGADTKQYLYLDPARMLARATSMWDPHVGMGTVTHQNIGYLLPQGPWYWLFHELGVPVWVAQRLWTGSLLFAAGTGVLFLLRTLGWRRPVALVGALGYALSPYLLEYEARISAILLPWAGLPWMVGLVARGLRATRRPDGGGPKRTTRWRYPALFALVVALVGGTNATSLLYAGLGPALWLPFAVWGGAGEVPLRTALGFVARTALLTVLASLWWISGLATQAGYGLDVLAYSETVKIVASASPASEVVRGLGNWYFYGRDGIGAWIQPSVDYTANLALMAVSFAVPLLSFAAAAFVRWAHRAYFVTLVLVGTAISVGVYPYAHPSPFGSVLKAFQEGSTAGLALRSTPRAVPLVALGSSVLLAAGTDALARAVHLPRLRWLPRAPRLATVATGVAVVLIAADMAPLWAGELVDPNLRRPERIPAYWTQAAAAMDAAGPSTRVLELPGSDFSDYRWGSTLDPVPPGLMDRPFVSRELIPYGTPASADLLRAVDRRLQEGVFETASLPDVARLMGVGDVELRSDLQYERFRTPRPQDTWQLFQSHPGLSSPRTFGPPVASTPVIPLTDEITLGTPASAPDPPAVALFHVSDPEPIVRAERAASPLLVAGDGEGLVDASAAGLLHDTGVALYSASMATDPAAMRQALADGATLLVTDSNRRRAEGWGSVRENYGYTERAGEKPLVKDPGDNRLPVFPGAGDDTRTVAELTRAGAGPAVASVEATHYGNPVSYAPSDRPDYAVDGDPSTAWRVGAFSDVVHERLRVTLDGPVTTDHLQLVQPVTGRRNRWMTEVALRFDGGPAVDVALTDASRTSAGQRIDLGMRTFHRVEVEVLATNVGRKAVYTGVSGVGIAELGIPGVRAQEVLRLPTDLLAAAGTASASHPLDLLLTRDRANPAEPFKSDSELSMARDVLLPTARTFALAGTARVSALAPDQLLDAALGRPLRTGVATASSSGRLPGALGDRAGSAADGDPSTLWSPGPGSQTGGWLEVDVPAPLTTDRLDLSVVADGRHSVPARMTLVVDGRAARQLTVPALPDRPGADVGRAATVRFAAVTGHSFRVVVDAVREVRTRDYFGGGLTDLPVGITELGLPGVRVPAVPVAVPSPCRSDLLTVDGRPVPVRVSGSSAPAQARGGLTVRLCGPALHLSAGHHLLRTARGQRTGIDLDRLVLASAAGGGAAAPTVGATAGVATAAARTSGAPTVDVRSQGATSFHLRVTGATPGQPFWLVLGQSRSTGWTASVDGHRVSGPPTLVDGYANGWRVTPGAGQRTLDVRLTWTPQRRVDVALVLSALALLGCLALALVPVVRGRRRVAVAAEPFAAEPFADPVLDGPLSSTGTRPSPAVSAAGTAGAGLVAGFLVTPAAGVVVAAAVLVALVVPRGRLLLRLGPLAALAGTALYVLEVQYRYRLPSNGQWAASFSKVATLSWLAVVLLAADVLADALRRCRGSRLGAPSSRQDTAEPSPGGRSPRSRAT